MASNDHTRHGRHPRAHTWSLFAISPAYGPISGTYPENIWVLLQSPRPERVSKSSATAPPQPPSPVLRVPVRYGICSDTVAEPAQTTSKKAALRPVVGRAITTKYTSPRSGRGSARGYSTSQEPPLICHTRGIHSQDPGSRIYASAVPVCTIPREPVTGVTPCPRPLDRELSGPYTWVWASRPRREQ